MARPQLKRRDSESYELDDKVRKNSMIFGRQAGDWSKTMLDRPVSDWY